MQGNVCVAKDVEPLLFGSIEKNTQGKYIKLPSCVSRRNLCLPTTKTLVQEVCKQRTGN